MYAIRSFHRAIDSPAAVALTRFICQSWTVMYSPTRTFTLPRLPAACGAVLSSAPAFRRSCNGYQIRRSRLMNRAMEQESSPAPSQVTHRALTRLRDAAGSGRAPVSGLWSRPVPVQERPLRELSDRAVG